MLRPFQPEVLAHGRSWSLYLMEVVASRGRYGEIGLLLNIMVHHHSKVKASCHDSRWIFPKSLHFRHLQVPTVRFVTPSKPVHLVDMVCLIVAWLAVLGICVICGFLAVQDLWQRWLVLGASGLLCSTASQRYS